MIYVLFKNINFILSYSLTSWVLLALTTQTYILIKSWKQMKKKKTNENDIDSH